MQPCSPPSPQLTTWPLEPGCQKQACEEGGKSQTEPGLLLPPRAFWTTLLEINYFFFFFSPLLNNRPNALFPVLAELLASAGWRSLPGTWLREHRPNWSGQSALWLLLPGLARVYVCVCVCACVCKRPTLLPSNPGRWKAASGTSLAVRPDGWS